MEYIESCWFAVAEIPEDINPLINPVIGKFKRGDLIS
jgi:hypothetical protein